MSDSSKHRGDDKGNLEVGLSIRTLCHSDFKGQVDGIGVYTRELWKQFDAMPDIGVHPVVGFGGRYRELAKKYSGGFNFPVNYGASSALSIVSKAPFPGANRLAKRIDVYHATDYWIPKLNRVPVVATLHDAIPLSHPEWAVPKYRSAKNILMRVAAHWADAVITVSNAMVPSLVEQFRVPAERITVIHNGIDGEWFQRMLPETRIAVLSRHGLPPRFFLTVGTLQPRKNLGRILAAHCALPARIRREHALVIVGRMGWGVDDLIPAIRAGHAAGEIFWLDYVPHTELRAIFQSAHALVFPSLHEGFGMPVVEAFASGVPVITSNVSALPEVAGDAALQVDPHDTDAIREAMLRLSEDPALFSNLVLAGYLRAAAFSWQTCAEQVRALYRKVSGV